jgi:NAD(P)-dependent dehydrogenase (short-subunit alcohol dehydrogenase family)
MKNKVILITGALTGIGRATAIALAREGAHIVVCGRRDDVGNALATELRALGVEAEYIRADVRHEEDVRGLVDGTVKRFGHLDVAVNNAGTEGKPGPVTEQTAESYASTFDSNVLGTLLSLKHELRVMLPRRQGSIVNVSSTFGRAGASVYVASKHAVEGLTKAAALEIAPPWVQTDLLNSNNEPRAMPLAEFIEETINVLRTDAEEVLVERAKQLRNNAGPNEGALVTQFNDMMTQSSSI